MKVDTDNVDPEGNEAIRLDGKVSEGEGIKAKSHYRRLQILATIVSLS